MMRILKKKKVAHGFFVGIKERKEIYILQKLNKKPQTNTNRKNNWDLISCPIVHLFTHFHIEISTL